MLSNGQYAKVQATRSIHYDTPQTTYNFEVEGFHTYYVETGVLVHNKNCSNTVTVDNVDDALNLAEQHLGPKQHYYKNNKNYIYITNILHFTPRRIHRVFN
ncbi:MAG: hypothetical protein OSJ68_03450 [Clostridia bacterium]|nr:hypothetical protein [Clostridia bacterium]